MIGQTLNHYRIESKLGEGGMGVVYKARDIHLDRPVAIKVLTPEAASNPTRRQRFVQEARAASALDHPNIVTVHDMAEVDGQHFIVMQYVAGKTLRELLRQEGLPWNEILRYAIQIADALGQAHAHGIVHRDLKPENIMVTEQGQVKILDFGLAKLAERTESNESALTETLKLDTEEGTILGTVAYMSPEQAEGRKVDARSDIFSFGSVLYEMLSGRRAFQGDTRMSTLSAILTKEPTPLLEVAGQEVPAEMQKIIARCLRKDPERRLRNFYDLKLALEELKEESGSGPQAPARVGRATSRRRWASLTLLGVLLVAAGYIGWRVWHAPEGAEPMHAVALTTFPGAELFPSFSPDGNHVAFTWTGPKQDNPDIYVLQIGSGTPFRLTTDPRGDYNPVWSPDGRWIAFLRGESFTSELRYRAGRSELRLIPPLGGPERKLAEIQLSVLGVTPPYFDWCPDNTCLVIADSPAEQKPVALYVVSVETGEKRPLTNPPSPLLGDSNPAVSPDGQAVVFRRTVAIQAGELYRLPLTKDHGAGGEPKRLTPASLNAEFPAWMPDGKEVLFSARRSLWRLAIPGGSQPARIPFVGEDGWMPAVTGPQRGRAARLVYVNSFRDVNIWRVETSAPGMPSSSGPVVAIHSTQVEYDPQISPDGRRVAFQSNRSGAFEVWLADPDGSNAVHVTTMQAQDTGTPGWSPNGQLIAFDSNLEGQQEIYVISASGGKPRRLTFHPANDFLPSFSRDGNWVYFSSNRTGAEQIWKIPVAGGEAIQVTTNGGRAGFESLDGVHLYYSQIDNSPGALWRVPTSGGESSKVLDGVMGRAFAVVEKGLYYVEERAGENQLRFFEFATGRSTSVARNLGRVVYGLSASSDGRTILFSRVDSTGADLMLVENFR